jgi:hypothetical protein
MRFAISGSEIPLYLAWLQKREGSSGLMGGRRFAGNIGGLVMAQTYKLASVFEPGVFTIIAAVLF